MRLSSGAMLEKESYTFMYEEGAKLILMHPGTFEQVSCGGWAAAAASPLTVLLAPSMNMIAPLSCSISLPTAAVLFQPRLYPTKCSRPSPFFVCQVELPRASLGESAAFLSEGMPIQALRYGEDIVSAVMEELVDCEVKSAGPSMKVCVSTAPALHPDAPGCTHGASVSSWRSPFGPSAFDGAPLNCLARLPFVVDIVYRGLSCFSR